LNNYPKELAHKQVITKFQGSSKHELNSELNTNAWPLRYNISIIAAITKGSHICSHQRIGDHCKKENHTRRQTQARRV